MNNNICKDYMPEIGPSGEDNLEKENWKGKMNTWQICSDLAISSFRDAINIYDRGEFFAIRPPI